MKYVAIIKTYGSKPNLKYPQGYPNVCVEFDSLEMAREKYPDAIVMTEKDYKDYHASFNFTPKPQKKLNWFQRVILRKKVYFSSLQD